MTRLDPIEVVAYDTTWPERYAEQAEVLGPILAPALARPLEHIGSTAVPGLAAKPIIDMLAVVHSTDDVAALGSDLAAAGWCRAPEPGDKAGRRSSWCCPTVEWRSHHLHVVERSSPDWPTWLAFRDHLRLSARDRTAYAALKQRLASADQRDRVAYRAAKAPFIRRVLAGLQP